MEGKIQQLISRQELEKKYCGDVQVFFHPRSLFIQVQPSVYFWNAIKTLMLFLAGTGEKNPHTKAFFWNATSKTLNVHLVCPPTTQQPPTTHPHTPDSFCNTIYICFRCIIAEKKTPTTKTNKQNPHQTTQTDRLPCCPIA